MILSALLTLFAVMAGICLTVVIVVWGTRRLRLPVEETLLWFGLVEYAEPGGPPQRPRGE